MRKTPYYSYAIGKLSEGCRFCVKGRKSVFYITGLCTRRCYYCPLSEQKRYKDVLYINELRINDDRKGVKHLLEEIRISKSYGAGITGGDPLLRLNRTIKFIKILKREFGRKFHLHLYTPLNLVTKSTMRRLCEAGLDEIRFHPDIHSRGMWSRIDYALPYKWKVGVEIPVIPGKFDETVSLIELIKNKVDFLNLNELEYSDTNAQSLGSKRFFTKGIATYAIKGSNEMALRLLRYIDKNKIKLNVHYCTAKLKDAVQLTNRMKLRSASIRKDYDIVTDEGMLVRGAIYVKGMEPEFSYKEKLKAANKKKFLPRLEKMFNTLRVEHGVPPELVFLDREHLRILTNLKVVSKLAKELKKKGFVPCIIEEHPTADYLIVTLERL